THALHPPIVATISDRIPAIERIAPALPGLAEGVRRHTRYIRRAEVRVQVIKLRMGPNVSAVIADENGDVADYPDAATIARHPRSARRSRLISSSLPANAETPE